MTTKRDKSPSTESRGDAKIKAQATREIHEHDERQRNFATGKKRFTEGK